VIRINTARSEKPILGFIVGATAKVTTMPIETLKRFLDDNHVKFISIRHSPAFTASEIAEKAHVPRQELAKTVIVRVNGKLAMAVVPATQFVDLPRLATALGADKVELAAEYEFEDTFPGCEVGAAPPFGNLYGMTVYAAKSLARDTTIAFNAGTHAELIKIDFNEFVRLVKPRILDF
jgi:Ala-tRNA(Pro) deacylase